MNINENNGNGSPGMSSPVSESSEPISPPGPIRAPEPIDGNAKTEPVTRFATRATVKGTDGVSKGKLILLGTGLAVAVIFFVFTAIVGKSSKK
jgi:hypothetical protein